MFIAHLRAMSAAETQLLTLTVVAEGHLGLTKTNCVLSGADTVELLELRLLDILQAADKRCLSVQVLRQGSAMSARRGRRKTQT